MKFSEWLDRERGRTKSLAERFGLTESAITQWRTNGVPVARMMDILKISDGAVTLADMVEHRSSKAEGGAPTFLRNS